MSSGLLTYGKGQKKNVSYVYEAGDLVRVDPVQWEWDFQGFGTGVGDLEK